MGTRSVVILPTYNEAENVLALAREILGQDDSLDVVVVDDASPDGTGVLVKEAMKTEPRLALIEREGKLGLGSAYRTGFRYALDQGYARVFTMDCDFSHSPHALPRFLEAIQDADLVIGSRYVPGGGIANWPRRRQLLSRFANLYTRILLRVPVNDCTSGYRCYRREVLEVVNPFESSANGYSFLEEMVWRVHRSGFRITEVPIIFEDRVRGASKIDSTEIYRAAWHVLRTAVRRFPRSGGARTGA